MSTDGVTSFAMISLFSAVDLLVKRTLTFVRSMTDTSRECS